MKKLGRFLLAIFVATSIVFGTAYRKASADERVESRIIATHENIIQLREKKMNDCALMTDFPKSLL